MTYFNIDRYINIHMCLETYFSYMKCVVNLWHFLKWISETFAEQPLTPLLHLVCDVLKNNDIANLTIILETLHYDLSIGTIRFPYHVLNTNIHVGITITIHSDMIRNYWSQIVFHSVFDFIFRLKRVCKYFMNFINRYLSRCQIMLWSVPNSKPLNQNQPPDSPDNLRPLNMQLLCF